jgi:hypothetical protein
MLVPTSCARVEQPEKTDIVRLRVLTYNTALAMLGALTVHTRLSKSGILITRTDVNSFPVQEYMPHNRNQLLAGQLLLLLWTVAHMLKEFDEIASDVRIHGTIRNYLSEPFNWLDWTRFAACIAFVCVRTWLHHDDSRDIDIHVANSFFIDTEAVQLAYYYLDLLACYVRDHT